MKLVITLYYRIDGMGINKFNYLKRLEKYGKKYLQLTGNLMDFHHWSNSIIKLNNVNCIGHKKRNIIKACWQIDSRQLQHHLAL